MFFGQDKFFRVSFFYWTFEMTKPTSQTHLFFSFFFLGESSSEPFLPLPLEPRFSLSLESLSVVNSYILNAQSDKRCFMRCMYACPYVVIHLIKWRPNSYPSYFSLLFHLYSRSHSRPVSLLAHSQSVQDLHPVCGCVCPPAGAWKISWWKLAQFKLQIINISILLNNFNLNMSGLSTPNTTKC